MAVPAADSAETERLLDRIRAGEKPAVDRLFDSARLSPSQHLLRSEFIRRVREAVGRLPEGDREVLILRKLEGLSNQETAHLLDIDPATASRRFGRAVLRLREILIQAGLM